MNLFCFAYAGGSSIAFSKWKRYAGPSIHVVPVEMPGRGVRFAEELCDNMDDLIDDLFNKIKGELVKESYILYGHSMGSWIVYFLVSRIMKEGLRLPQGVFVSGKEAPHIIKKEKKIHKLENCEFLDVINSLGGTPKEILDNEEMLEIFVPIIKNDYKVIETCHFEPLPHLLACDIRVFNGRQDKLTEQDLLGWKIYTGGNFQLYQFDGGHFFIHQYGEEMMSIIRNLWDEEPAAGLYQSQIERRKRVVI